MSYFRVDGWGDPGLLNEEFQPGTFLGSSALLFTGGSPPTPTRFHEEAVAHETGDCWLLELLGDDHCVRVLIAEGEEG